MKSEKIILKAYERVKDKKYIPAMIYGKNIDKNILISIFRKDGEALFKKIERNEIFSIEFKNTQYDVLMQNIERNPKTWEILHLNFFNILENSKVKVKVEVKLKNLDTAEIKKTSKVSNSNTLISLICKNKQTISNIYYDVNTLKENQSIRLSDLNLPNFCEIRHNHNIHIIKSKSKNVKE